MDCEMPIMNGFDATRKILEICQQNGAPPPYIIALTAHSENEAIRMKCLDAGMSEMRSKPIHIEALKEILVRLNLLK